MTNTDSDMPVSGITVIICTWNRAEQLRTTLQSISRQELPPGVDVEVLVVDNNSKDHTRRAVEEMQSSWPLGVLSYLFEPRQGKQFALNTGIAAARLGVLAFTDDDILFPPDWLRQIQRVFSDSGVELAGGKTLIDWTGVPRPAWYGDDMLAVLAGVDDGDERLDPAPRAFAPGGSNLIARRVTFERFGRYSEAHFRHMDHEFGMRCHAKGARVVYDPGLVVHAPVDPACLTPRYFLRWAFKAGIARTGGIHAAGQLPSVPLWMYRRFLQDAFVLSFKPSLGTPSVFAQRMRKWRDLGAIANAWHAWLVPRWHSEWVKRQSQKKNNVY
ncbi:MAG: glycosyltransferase family 2 protein [Betaproteobacteria bacterium]